jgi:hypothetical protein
MQIEFDHPCDTLRPLLMPFDAGGALASRPNFTQIEGEGNSVDARGAYFERSRRVTDAEEPFETAALAESVDGKTPLRPPGCMT